MPIRGMGALSGVSALILTMKERPYHVSNDLMASKQRIRPPEASKSSPDGKQHSEGHRHSHREHGVARCASMKYNTKSVTSDMHST